ncbi:lactate utilization protein C [Bacillus daqingensis]|uniref:Lactate utilization protein C n=1 Tax=Bacillus daqingensis TaxID=872396 RepID=A0ABV9NSV3_9BACI
MGTIHNQDTFLANIADRLGRSRRTEGVNPPVWTKQPQHEVFAGASPAELQEILIRQCDAIHTSVDTTQKADLPDVLASALERFGSSPAVYWSDERFADFGVDHVMDSLEESRAWTDENREEMTRFAERAKIGVTFSDITLAESGTVVLFSAPGKGRAVSLLPEVHIALIPRSTIVPRMTQAASEIHKRCKEDGTVPSCVNFISGPSNSADIEMRLIVGVHGPISAHYIIIEDA